jgi:EamA domain-containing membrane protein RarD
MKTKLFTLIALFAFAATANAQKIRLNGICEFIHSTMTWILTTATRVTLTEQLKGDFNGASAWNIG